jgi:hypothetical protein
MSRLLRIAASEAIGSQAINVLPGVTRSTSHLGEMENTQSHKVRLTIAGLNMDPSPNNPGGEIPIHLR